MTQRQLSPLNDYGLPGQSTQSSSAFSWTVISLFIFLTAFCILTGFSKVLNIGFPLGALAVGGVLYFRQPILYVGFLWWLWFVTPLIRRFIDYTSGYTEPSPVLLAPYLVTLISFITLWKRLPKTYRQGGLPYALSFIGLFYALLIGLAQGFGLVTVGKALLGWLVPPLLSFHLFANWRDYPRYRQNTQRIFLWAVLLMGSYAIYQYLVAPDWDMFWLTNSGFTSAGRVEPMGFRVWSTLNSPGPFGNVMKSCLLILFSTKGVLLAPSMITGYLAFLLSMIRSAWGGWFVGVLVFASSLKSKYQMQLIITILVFGVVIFFLANMESFSAISSRFDTLSDLENDGSANIRRRYFSIHIVPALTSFVGKGIGDRHYDWGIFTFLFNLGWIGTIFYAGGLFALIFQLFQGNDSQNDKFLAAARAIVFSNILQLPFGSIMIDVLGIMLWGFLGIGLAARQYHQFQRKRVTDGRTGDNSNLGNDYPLQGTFLSR